MWIFSRDSKSKKTQTVYDTIRKHRISMSEKIVQINLYIELILIQNAIDRHSCFQIHVSRFETKTYR